MKKYQEKFARFNLRINQVLLLDYLPDVIDQYHPARRTLGGLAMGTLVSAFGDENIARRIAACDKFLAPNLRAAGGVFIAAQCGYIDFDRVEFNGEGEIITWEWTEYPRHIYAHADSLEAAIEKLLLQAKAFEEESLRRAREEFQAKRKEN